MKRTPLKRKPSRRERAPQEWTTGLRWTPCEACGTARSVHAHHIITAQVLRREGLPLWDVANRMLLCFQCHGAHHARTRVLVIPDDHPVWAYADEHDLAWFLSRTYLQDRAA